MKKIIILLIISCSATLWAEPIFDKAMGVTASPIGGMGYSYRQILGKHGYQVTGGFMQSEDNTWMNIGAEYIRPIHQVSETRLNFVAGAAIWNDIKHEINEVERVQFIGMGPEVEFTFSYNMRCIVGIPFIFIYNEDIKESYVSFYPAISLMYYFQ